MSDTGKMDSEKLSLQLLPLKFTIDCSSFRDNNNCNSSIISLNLWDKLTFLHVDSELYLYLEFLTILLLLVFLESLQDMRVNWTKIDWLNTKYLVWNFWYSSILQRHCSTFWDCSFSHYKLDDRYASLVYSSLLENMDTQKFVI